jgi:exodeoxyribonuclease VII large subunit
VADVARALPRPAELIETRRQRLDLAAARLPRPRRLIGDAREPFERVATRLPPALTRAVERARLDLTRRGGGLVPRLLSARIERHAERLTDRAARLDPAARRCLAAARDRLTAQGRLLGSLGYRQTLARGYAVVRDAEGGVVTAAASVEPGAPLEIEFADDRVSVAATGARPAPAAKPKPKATPPKPGGGRQGSLF